MYCKNCGKPLAPRDKFCSNCGTKVEKEFVPAFKQTEFTPQDPEEKKPRKKITVEKFNWDLEGYPTDHRKTEDIDFNWDSVLEEKQRAAFGRPLSREPREERKSMWEARETPGRTEPAVPVGETFETTALPEDSKVSKAEAKETSAFHESLSEDVSLEDAIFADMGALNSEEPTRVSERGGKVDRLDKFYTFNKKQEELQVLLDEEYERIKNGTGSEEPGFTVKPSGKHEEFDWTLPGDRGPESFAGRPAQAKTEAEAPLIFDDALLMGERYLGVAFSKAPLGYIASLEEQAAQGPRKPAGLTQTGTKQEETVSETAQFPPSAEEPDEKKAESRLTFNDVFGADDDDAEEKPKKKGTALKVIAVILCILLAAELVMIGIQHFAPESKAAVAINNAYEYILEKISGEGETEESASKPEEPEVSETAALIEAKKGLGKNIGAIEENQELLFEDGKNYGFDDFANSYTFVDKPWYTDDEGNSVSYGEEIIGTVIQFYSAWVDKINGKNEVVLDFLDDTGDFYTEIESLEGDEGVQYGIDKLELGEIRAGSSGFYICVSAVKVGSDTEKETKETQIIYMEPVNKTMKIVDMKEI